MKSRDVINKLLKAGFVFSRHGGNHDIYSRGNDTEKVPRHKELNEITAKLILKRWGIK